MTTLLTIRADDLSAPYFAASVASFAPVASAVSALDAAKQGMRGVFAAAFVAFLGSHGDATVRDASKEFSRMVPESKSGSGATYRSGIVKALGDSALLARLRAPFTVELLATLGDDAFRAQVAESAAILCAALKEAGDAARSAPKADKPKSGEAVSIAPPAAPPAPEKALDVLTRIMADLDTLIAEAAIGNVDALAAYDTVVSRIALPVITKARKAA